MPRPSWGSRALASGLAAIFFAGGILHLGSMLPAAPYPVTAATQDVTRTIERVSLGAVPDVALIRTSQRPLSQEPVGEALEGMGLEPWRDLGLRGAGAKVAIADLGFDGYTALTGTELPAQVVSRSFRQDGDITGAGDPHGTAAAEVIFDIAPDATYYFVNFSTEVELGNAVDWLITQKVDLISESVGWPGTAF